MNGYISVTDYDTRTTIYINVSTIASISDWDSCTRIKITCGEWYSVRESVSEVCKKMESAIDSGSTKSLSIETTSNGWIHVKDRLPDDLDSVQIAYKILPNGCVYRDCIAYRKNDTWYLSYNENIVISKTVVAWKPLSETVVAWKPLSDVYATADLWRCEE